MRTVAIVAVFIVLVGLSFFLVHSPFEEDVLYIETRSPKGTYTLLFEGKTDRTDMIAGVSEMVKLTVVKDQTTYFVSEILTSVRKDLLHTFEVLTLVEIFYGKEQRFFVF